MIIRELLVDDTEQYRILRLECLERFPRSFGMSYEEFLDEPIEKTRESIETSFQKKDTFLLGAFGSERLIGLSNFSRNIGKKERHKGSITRVYVTPSEQGKGIATELIGEIIRRVRSIPEMSMIHLEVSEDNTYALKLYRSYGFQEYGKEPRAYKFEDGSFSAGNLLMLLELDKK